MHARILDADGGDAGYEMDAQNDGGADASTE
jgi:hypothetical protein